MAFGGKNDLTEDDEESELVGMGLRVSVSPAQTAFYILLVLLGIIGNATVVGVIGNSVIKERGGGRNSDIIIMNMALSNLLVSLMRNTLLVISDIGLEVCGRLRSTENQSPFSLFTCLTCLIRFGLPRRRLEDKSECMIVRKSCRFMIAHLFLLQMYSSKEWCQFLMGIWVWLRSVNVWSTLFLSAFHLQTLRRVAPTVGNIHGSRGAPKSLLFIILLIWLLNLVYSIPAHIFSTNGNVNSTEVRPCRSSRLR